MADALGNESLYNVAFLVLGQMPERILPELILGWFVALLVLGSEGRTRILGAILLAVTIGAEVVTLVGPAVGINAPDIKLRWLLPFVWLLFESAKAASGDASRSATGARLVDSPAT